MTTESSYYLRTDGSSVVWTVSNENDESFVGIFASSATFLSSSSPSSSSSCSSSSSSSLHLVQKIRFPFNRSSVDLDSDTLQCADWNVEWSSNSGHLVIFDNHVGEVAILAPCAPLQWDVHKIFSVFKHINDRLLSHKVLYLF
jgi:hypothetical protein